MARDDVRVAFCGWRGALAGDRAAFAFLATGSALAELADAATGDAAFAVLGTVRAVLALATGLALLDAARVAFLPVPAATFDVFVDRSAGRDGGAAAAAPDPSAPAERAPARMARVTSFSMRVTRSSMRASESLATWSTA